MEDAGHGLGVARRLRESMVKAATASACHVRDHAVHYLTAFFVGIEILIKIVPEIASALRDADGIHAFYRSDGLRIVLEAGKEVANGGESHSCDRRIFCDIDNLVNLSWFKASVEMDVMRIIGEFALDVIRE